MTLCPIKLVKFIYSEKATKFCEIFSLLLSYVVPVKSKMKISQNFVAFSEYLNFNYLHDFKKSNVRTYVSFLFVLIAGFLGKDILKNRVSLHLNNLPLGFVCFFILT